MTTAGRVVRVLVADDEPLIRAGVSALLATDPTIEVVAEVSDGRAALEAARGHRPDIVLLDLQMPEMDGLTALAELTRTQPEIKIIVLTTFGQDANIRRALVGGAAGFLIKASDPRELITAVHAVADGAAFLSPQIADRVVAHYRAGSSGRDTSGPDRVALLTDRERDVLGLVSSGMSTAEIGRRLFMVEGTVKGHVSAILTKLRVRNRVQAAIVGYENGLGSRR